MSKFCKYLIEEKEKSSFINIFRYIFSNEDDKLAKEEAATLLKSC